MRCKSLFCHFERSKGSDFDLLLKSRSFGKKRIRMTKFVNLSLFLTLAVLWTQTVYAAEPAALNTAEISKSKLQLAVLKQEWGRDPFSLAEKKGNTQAAESPVKLMGILTRGDKKIAIVNKVFVRTGESVQGYDVIAIENDRVILNKDGEETVLRIAEHEKKF